ncbi:hypothetical protein JRK10_004922 [Salmonella enterica]|nr:hypothetical protein [Salmonella enterica]OIN18667.1 hypothetical protein AO411_2019815 [Salmonella enterica subsp. enterica serovar Sarajane]
MNTQNVKTAAHESTERCGRKGKKANVLFRMAVVSSQPVADSEMKAMCNYIRHHVPTNDFYHVVQHVNGCNMDLTLLLRIKTFKGSTGSRSLGFFVGERFLALLCVNEKGMYLERHSMQMAFVPFAQTPGFENLPRDMRAVNFYSSLEASQRAELLNVLYTRHYNEGEKVSCSEVNMRIAGTIRDILGGASYLTEETLSPYFKKINTKFK